MEVVGSPAVEPLDEESSDAVGAAPLGVSAAASPARAQGWSYETSRPVQRHVFAGGHFFPTAHQAGLTALIAADLAADVGVDR